MSDINELMKEALTLLVDAKDLKDKEGDKSINYLAKKAEGWVKARYALKQANEDKQPTESCHIGDVSVSCEHLNSYRVGHGMGEYSIYCPDCDTNL